MAGGGMCCFFFLTGMLWRVEVDFAYHFFLRNMIDRMSEINCNGSPLNFIDLANLF